MEAKHKVEMDFKKASEIFFAMTEEQKEAVNIITARIVGDVLNDIKAKAEEVEKEIKEAK